MLYKVVVKSEETKRKRSWVTYVDFRSWPSGWGPTDTHGVAQQSYKARQVFLEEYFDSIRHSKYTIWWLSASCLKSEGDEGIHQG